MTKFYIFDEAKRDWICIKQRAGCLAKVNKCIYNGITYNVDQVIFNLDTDITEVMLCLI